MPMAALGNGAMPNKSGSGMSGSNKGGWQDAVSLVNSQKVMTLSTMSSVGTWSAPVYYQFSDQTFFFFSSPESRHIVDGLTADICSAASIFEDHTRFDKIRGIQMSGQIVAAGASPTTFIAAADYVKKFGIPVSDENPLALIEKQFHAKLYKFLPEQIFLMDNQNGFGNRKEIFL